MNIRTVKQDAAGAMAVAREPRKVILVYAGVMTLLSLALTVVNVWLGEQISNTGGLANLGLQTVLSTVQMVLPLAQTVVLLCLELGYLSAAMRFARKQYADHTDLMTGFHRFGPLIRLVLMQGAIYLGLFFVSSWLGTQIFLMTPYAAPLLMAMEPLMNSSILSGGDVVMDEAALTAMTDAMVPMMVIVLAVFAVLAIPVMFRYRMANYRLLDKPREGAFAALRNSRAMMRGNALNLLKLDLSFWWYYLLTAVAGVICYGDQLLPLLGVELPIPPMVSYFLFYGLYLVAQFAIYYFFRNPLEVTYVMAYESIRPEEKEDGVILGNIFTM